MNIVQIKILKDLEISEEELGENKAKSPWDYCDTIQSMLYRGYHFDKDKRSFKIRS